MNNTILVKCAIKYNGGVCFLNIHTSINRKREGWLCSLRSESLPYDCLNCFMCIHHDALEDPHSSAMSKFKILYSQLSWSARKATNEIDG